jgi:hypothetical protein
LSPDEEALPVVAATPAVVPAPDEVARLTDDPPTEVTEATRVMPPRQRDWFRVATTMTAPIRPTSRHRQASTTTAASVPELWFGAAPPAAAAAGPAQSAATISPATVARMILAVGERQRRTWRRGLDIATKEITIREGVQP